MHVRQTGLAEYMQIAHARPVSRRICRNNILYGDHIEITSITVGVSFRLVSPYVIKTAWHHHCSRLEHGTDLGIKFVTTKSSLTDGQRMTQDKVRQGSPRSLVKAVEGAYRYVP